MKIYMKIYKILADLGRYNWVYWKLLMPERHRGGLKETSLSKETVPEIVNHHVIAPFQP